jgi:hypothetical protein
MADKVYKDIIGFEGLYKISNFGDVFSIKENRDLKYHTNKKGYCSICLTKDKKEYSRLVHRLVAEAFLGQNEGLQVNHINGNKSDNFVGNLEWCTSSENINHAYQVLNKRGGQSKYVINLETGIFYESAKEAAKYMNIKYCTLRAMLSGQNPNKTNLKYA